MSVKVVDIDIGYSNVLSDFKTVTIHTTRFRHPMSAKVVDIDIGYSNILSL
ncbi:hypothetical protein AGMMS49936_06500 [Endomicrobiia bacterium]|nr:hypothetical protein AGMMS49936_06500 [Endomicrobiia bacterium]